MFRRFQYSLQRFMYGRYGTDKLNIVLLIGGVIVMLISSLIYQLSYRAGNTGIYPLVLIFRLLSDAMLVWAIFRTLSRNISARQRENQWLQCTWRNISDRQNRYFQCPRCRQTVRVPRGRGKICIRCPRCSEKFVRKS